jgi:hypothetical protein
MARIKTFYEGTQDVKRHPTEVDCFAQVFTTPEGDHYLHLSTFGSKDRASDPKSSQSIQLDETNAAELLKWLIKAFPRLAA